MCRPAAHFSGRGDRTAATLPTAISALVPTTRASVTEAQHFHDQQHLDKKQGPARAVAPTTGNESGPRRGTAPDGAQARHDSCIRNAGCRHPGPASDGLDVPQHPATPPAGRPLDDTT